MTLEIGDIVLCTVDRIVGTIVFVNIAGEEREGSIVFSEVAPGRIRNIRDYVVPKKKIVCKVLRISSNRIDLSLRRVTQKEKKEMLEQIKHEKSYKSILKTILKEKANEAIKKIEENQNIYEFLEESKENPKELEKIIGKEKAKEIIEIIKKQRSKIKKIKKEFVFTSKEEDGLDLIKKILGSIKNAKISYISAGKYSIETEDENVKEADNKIKRIFEEIDKKSKKYKINFSEIE